MIREITLSLLILCTIWNSATAISCYNCTSTIREYNVETRDIGCANVTSSTPKSTFNGTTTCTTTVNVDGGVVTIARSGSAPYSMNATRNYCESSRSGTNICYCITGDNCNSEGLAAGQYDCYDCSSSDYFDNGCGETVDPSSKYVNIVRGCGGCSKTVEYDGDFTMRYLRGCIKGRYVQNIHCNGTSDDTCVCKGSLCNSAEKIKYTSASTTIILLIFLSALF